MKHAVRDRALRYQSGRRTFLKLNASETMDIADYINIKLKLSKIIREKSVLDIGCGMSRHSPSGLPLDFKIA